MSTRRGAVLAAAVGVLLAVGGPARADATDLDGSWWSRFNAGLPVALPVTVPVPALPSGLAPDLVVQQLPDGPAGVAGLRVPVPAGTTPTTLTVHLTAPAVGASLGACATAATWASTRGGPWDARPACTGTVVAVALSPDATSGTVDVTRLDLTRARREGVLDRARDRQRLDR